MGLQSIQRFCADLTPDEFFHQAVPGSNSAAWIIGHLTISAKRAADRVGATGLPEIGDDFVARYKATRQPAGDQRGLDAKGELLALFESVTNKLMEAIRRLPPEAVTGPPPNPAPPWVTNSGEMLLFGAMHFTMHGGQISTIRRSLGKPPMV